jgi:hypothetical protein
MSIQYIFFACDTFLVSNQVSLSAAGAVRTGRRRSSRGLGHELHVQLRRPAQRRRQREVARVERVASLPSSSTLGQQLAVDLDVELAAGIAAAKVSRSTLASLSGRSAHS